MPKIRHAKYQAKEMNLNITSLMDIMTIILIFLLVSFSTQESEITPPKSFDLPSSVSQKPIKIAVKVSISDTDIRVEDQVVAKLFNGRLHKRALDGDKNIVRLLRELQKEKGRIESATREESTDPDEDDENEIVYFEAARGTHFALIDRVLKTAAAAGFTKFRLAVNKRV